MKFRRIVSLFILAIIVVAFFTNPKQSDFTTFIQPEIKQQSAAPLIQYKNNLIYSVAEITFFKQNTEEGRFVANALKEKYIGIFGRFWKVDY